MRLKYIFLAFLIVSIVGVQQATAQIKVTNEDGDKIILMPDGTWKYADKNKQETASNDVKANQKSGKAKVNKKKLTKAEKKKLEKIAADKKRSEKIRKKLVKQRERKAKEEAEKRAKEEKKKAKLAAKAAKKNKTKNSKSSKSKKEKVAKNKSNRKTKKERKGKDSKRLADNNTKGAKKPSKKLQARLIKQQFKPFKNIRIVKYQEDCSYSMNEVDEFTRKRKISTTSKFFFGYTHPKLQEFLRGEHYLTCEGYMSQVGSLKSLNLKFTIDSPTAQDDYGNILEGSRLLVNLLDGTVITLISAEQDGGRIDRSKQQTIYKTFFIIDSSSEKKLRKSEISQVRMVWTKGYENYDIYEVDFIINALKCLNKAD